MTRKKPKHVLEKYFEQNEDWVEGINSFSSLFGNSMVWLVLVSEMPTEKMKLLSPKNGWPANLKSRKKQKESKDSLYDACINQSLDPSKDKPFEVKVTHCKNCILFPLIYLNHLKGYIALANVNIRQKQKSHLYIAFEGFISNLVNLAYKNFELNNFYETVHPRALALSTLHSLHRVIRSSLRLDDLLPRVARLCAQVLKARGCAIMLADVSGKYLIPKVVLGDSPWTKNKKHIKHRVGHGVEGKVGKTSEFYFTSKCMCVPLFEDDLVGVISVYNKIDNNPFSEADLEILKTLSEQAVVAIKNAQLYEESEALTLGSIKTINELMSLGYNVNQKHHQLLGDLTFELGKALNLRSDELTNVYRATYLLDAGHVGTPKDILEKESKLTRKELAKIKRHPKLGAELLRKIPSLKPLIPIILHHHERYDGQGYPNGLKGEDIPSGARIVAVVDSYVAMISPRPYRKEKSVTEAINEIKLNVGTQFDPEVVDKFVEVVEKRIRENKAVSFEQGDSQDVKLI